MRCVTCSPVLRCILEGPVGSNQLISSALYCFSPSGASSPVPIVTNFSQFAWDFPNFNNESPASPGTPQSAANMDGWLPWQFLTPVPWDHLPNKSSPCKSLSQALFLEGTQAMTTHLDLIGAPACLWDLFLFFSFGISIKSLYCLPSSLISAVTIACHSSQSSPIPTQTGLLLIPRFCEGPPSPSPSPDSPACISCESPDHIGCQGDTHHPSLPVPLGLGLLLPLYTWKLGDCGEAVNHLTLPLGMLITPLGMGPARE